MATIVGNCPRCGAQHTTFDVTEANYMFTQYNWQNWFECFSVCRNCHRATIFVISGDANGDENFRKKHPREIAISLTDGFKIERFVSLRDHATHHPPDHVPDEIKAVFEEAATSLAVQCWNAAGAMFRLCIDLVSITMLPTEDVPGLNSKTRRDLGLRLPWLFDNGKLPDDLRALSACIQQDGNDAAHRGTLTREDAEDLLDFTTELLERVFAEPARLQLAAERRASRRRQET